MQMVGLKSQALGYQYKGAWDGACSPLILALALALVLDSRAGWAARRWRRPTASSSCQFGFAGTTLTPRLLCAQPSSPSSAPRGSGACTKGAPSRPSSSFPRAPLLPFLFPLLARLTLALSPCSIWPNLLKCFPAMSVSFAVRRSLLSRSLSPRELSPGRARAAPDLPPPSPRPPPSSTRAGLRGLEGAHGRLERCTRRRRLGRRGVDLLRVAAERRRGRGITSTFIPPCRVCTSLVVDCMPHAIELLILAVCLRRGRERRAEAGLPKSSFPLGSLVSSSSRSRSRSQLSKPGHEQLLNGLALQDEEQRRPARCEKKRSPTSAARTHLDTTARPARSTSARRTRSTSWKRKRERRAHLTSCIRRGGA